MNILFILGASAQGAALFMIVKTVIVNRKSLRKEF
jgi:hypothetical protein